LRKLVEGGTDRSYGIQVARMAGIPPEVIDRAREILKSLERNGSGAAKDLGTIANSGPTPRKQKIQLTLFEAEAHPAIEELEAIDITSLTPVEALMKLDELKRMLNN
jgi:DNA mismatch repair protein MutS